MRGMVGVYCKYKLRHFLYCYCTYTSLLIHTRTYPYRTVAHKVDVLITGGSGGVDTRRPGDAVTGSIASELSQIKTTESNILHQLADLRFVYLTVASIHIP